MFYFIGLLILAAAIYVGVKAYDGDGFEWKKGIGALVALIVGLWVMFSELIHSIAK